MNQLSINKLKKMDPVGIRFNLHPIILFILALLGIYILYKAFWPKDKTYYRWKPANGAFLSSGQRTSMDNVASPALGNKYLPKHLRYGCGGAVEIVNGTAVPQQWLCENKQKILWEPIIDENGTHYTIDQFAKSRTGEVGFHVVALALVTDNLSETSITNKNDHYKKANVMHNGLAYKPAGRIDANTPWYSDCCAWDEDGASHGGGGICRPKVNADGPTPKYGP